MQTLLLNIWTKIKPAALSVASKAPLPVGIAIGYLAHGPIALALDAIRLALKLL